MFVAGPAVVDAAAVEEGSCGFPGGVLLLLVLPSPDSAHSPEALLAVCVEVDVAVVVIVVVALVVVAESPSSEQDDEDDDDDDGELLP